MSRFSLYLKAEPLALLNYRIYTIIWALPSLDPGLGTHTPETAMSLTEEVRKLRQQNRSLEKENAGLKEENEFLAEARAFFAASRRKSPKV